MFAKCQQKELLLDMVVIFNIRRVNFITNWNQVWNYGKDAATQELSKSRSFLSTNPVHITDAIHPMASFGAVAAKCLLSPHSTPWQTRQRKWSTWKTWLFHRSTLLFANNWLSDRLVLSVAKTLLLVMAIECSAFYTTKVGNFSEFLHQIYLRHHTKEHITTDKCARFW